MTQQMNIRQFLKTLVEKPRKIKETSNYCRQYISISRKLKKAGRLDKYTQYQLFVRGLPIKTRKEIFLHHQINPDGDTAPDFETILKTAVKIATSERRMRDFMKEGENEKISELVDIYNTKLVTAKEKKYISLIVESNINTEQSISKQVVIEKSIENLIKNISLLALATRSITEDQQKVLRQRVS